MLFKEHLIVIRGGGDLATGVAYRLHNAGFPVMVFELSHPLVVRRRVALASAVHENEVEVEGIRGVLSGSIAEGVQTAYEGSIPVIVNPDMDLPWGGERDAYKVLVDARMRKRNIDTNVKQAQLVIGLGPGFFAGRDCHVVIETKRGHRLGRAICQGGAIPDTRTPGIVDGKGAERVLRAPADGSVLWDCDIGQKVKEGVVIGSIGNDKIRAPFDGVVRGLIYPGTNVKRGLKIGDIDPRGDASACFTISDKALSIGGGVLEAVLVWLNQQQVKIEK